MTNWTTTDIPDQTGRTAVITGANTGLGYETAAALAAKGAHVVLAVRNTDKGKDAADRIADASPGRRASPCRNSTSRRWTPSARAAEELRSKHDSIDLLINNAGVMFTPKSTTKDGFELQFGTNHLGHFAFTGLLLDRVLRSPRLARRHGQQRRTPLRAQRHPLRRPAVGEGLQPGRRVRAGQAGQPAVHLRTAAPAARHRHHRRRRPPRRFADRTDPQPAAADRGRRRSWPNRSSRAPTWVRCRSCAPPPIPACIGGQYFGPDGFGEQRGYPVVVASSRASHDIDAQRRLWTVSEELTGVTFPVPATV